MSDALIRRDEPGTGAVLYLENNAPNLFLMELLLSQLGDLRMVAAADFDQAIETLTELAPLLVIADLHQPGMHGADGVRRLKAHPAMGTTPLIAVSTDHDAAVERAAREAGSDEFMTEPMDIQRLQTVVRALTDAERERRRLPANETQERSA
jgi:CheY-like chemotaxis protein